MMHRLSLRGIGLALASVVVLTGSLVGGGVALANDIVLQDNPSGTPGPYAGLRDKALENFYQRSLLAVESQQLRIDLANDVVDATQEWIDTLKGEGKDTSKLESALADFEAALATGKSEHDQAASILDAHAGFDDSGKVTDADQARDTLKSTREHLREAHQALREGTVEFRKTVREFRRENRPDKGGQETPAP